MNQSTHVNHHHADQMHNVNKEMVLALVNVFPNTTEILTKAVDRNVSSILIAHQILHVFEINASILVLEFVA